jgi:hypothetical protein
MSSLPEDARWMPERQSQSAEYRGVVTVPRRVFQRLLPERPIPEKSVAAYYLQPPRFESIAERELRRRQLRPIMGSWRSAGRHLCQSSPTVPLKLS